MSIEYIVHYRFNPQFGGPKFGEVGVTAGSEQAACKTVWSMIVRDNPGLDLDRADITVAASPCNLVGVA
ncbi:MAG: hypothetical protein AB7T17_01920 [Geobacter sp.]